MKNVPKVAAAILAGIALASASLVRADVDPAVLKAEQQRIAAIEKATPSVLAVFAAGGMGGGSGVVISPDGYALTNYHVTRASGTAMKCGMADGKYYDAVIVALDPTGDVALIKLLGRDDFPYAELGDSDKVRVGHWCFTMGNPFLLATDFQPSVAHGLVSGVHRYQYPAGTLLEYADCIQTDAAINPGNSGGPLFDAQGRLIGINGRGSFEKRGRVNVGVGYAISINQIKNFMGYLKSGRIVDHATLGATVTTDEDGNVVVQDILENSDAYRRGLRYDDDIVSFAGRPIRTVNAFKNVLGIYPKGWRVGLTYRRKGTTYDMLVRLQGVHRTGELVKMVQARPARRIDRPKKKPGDPPKEKPKRPKLPKIFDFHKPKPLPEIVKKHFKAKPGYANYYFNELNQQRVWKAFVARGDFSSAKSTWTLKCQSTQGKNIAIRLAKNEGEIQLPALRLKVDFTAELGSDLSPPGSGGFVLALHLWKRLLMEGPAKYGQVYYLGTMPLVGSKSVNVDHFVDVMICTHEGIESRFMFDPNDGRILAMEMFVDEETDPCEIYFTQYRKVDHRELPHHIEVRYGNRVYATLEVKSYQFQ